MQPGVQSRMPVNASTLFRRACVCMHACNIELFMAFFHHILPYVAVVGRTAFCCGNWWRTKFRTRTWTRRPSSGASATTHWVCPFQTRVRKDSSCWWNSAGIFCYT